VYRLLNVAGSQTETFTYDAAGNRLSDVARNYSIGSGNQVLTVGGESRSYDDLGNTTRAGEWSYTWNDAGELIRAQGSTADVSFKYDATGRRIQKAAEAGATRDYLYDSEDIAVEYIDGVPTFYLHGLGVDEPLALLRGGQAYFFHADGLGSIARITDSAGAVVKSYTYSSFGKIAAETGTLDQLYGFTGRERDTETGLNYHRARYYDAMVGRWLSRDPASFGGGDSNLYGYVSNNATNLVDANGQWAQIAFGVINGAAVGYLNGSRQGDVWTGVKAGMIGGVVGGSVAIILPQASGTAANIVTGATSGLISGLASGLVSGWKQKDTLPTEIFKGSFIGALSGATGGAVGHAARTVGAGKAVSSACEANVSRSVDLLGSFSLDILGSKRINVK